MSSSATQKKAHADAIPNMMRNWKLEVFNNPNLAMLNFIDITNQVHSGEQDIIRGRVIGGPIVSGYGIENGVVTTDSEVSFNVTTQGIVYTFTGTVVETVDGLNISGPIYNNGSALPHEKGSEDGSWSAQAQGGPGEEEEEKPPREHTKRSAR